MANSRFQYVRLYERAENDRRLLPGCYAVVRLDGRGFTRFSRSHAFAKPNDARALRLMDAAAAEVMRAFPEVALAYGQSDEYSFLLRRAGVPFERRSAKLATLFASTFAAAYVRFWPEFFGGAGGGRGDPFAPPPQRPRGGGQEQQQQGRRSAGDGEEQDGNGKGNDGNDTDDANDETIPLVSKEPGAFEDEERDAEQGRCAIEKAAAAAAAGRSPPAANPVTTTTPPPPPPPTPLPTTPLRSTPAFDARCVEYPTARTVRDYFSWRQADCHINNQYNTAFWALVQRGGLSPADAQRALKGTGTGEKNELLFMHGINYNDLPQRYRKGSVICWEEEEEEDEASAAASAQAASAPRQQQKHHPGRRRVLALRHCDVIRDAFWEERPGILDEDGDAGDGSGRGARR